MQAKKIGILGNGAKPQTKETVDELLKLLRQHGVTDCIISSELAAIASEGDKVHSSASPLQIASSSDIIFSLGGDGTLLTSARAIIRANPSVELIGVNL
ncbi:MAG: hypothetical protein Q8916_13340, partial [Bacteroidota bacterium]|nr:hypothetical protein [Bacteroidota bacterium]